MKKVHPLPVLIGLVAFWAADRLLGAGVPLITRLAHQPVRGTLFWILSATVVATAAALAGYLAAREAGPTESRPMTALALGIVTVVLSAGFSAAFGAASWSWWMYAVSLGPIVPAALVGARIVSQAGLTSAST